MIHVNNRGSWAVIVMSGELNSTTAPEMDEAISSAFASKGCNSLILDFSQLNYISSAGLRSVLIGGKSARERNGKFAIAGAGEKIRRVFQLSGLLRHFNSFDDLESAEKFVNSAE